jgi:hypothetical protein
MVVLGIVTGAGASSPTQIPGRGGPPVLADAAPLAAGELADSMLNALADTPAPGSATDKSLPIGAADLLRDTTPAERAHPSRLQQGRRVRLQHLNQLP